MIKFYILLHKYNYKIEEITEDVSERLAYRPYPKTNEIVITNSEDFYSADYNTGSINNITQKIKNEMYERIYDYVNSEIDNFNEKINNINKNENILTISRLKKLKKIL